MQLGFGKGWFAAFILVASLLPAPGLAQKASLAAQVARSFTGYHRYRSTVGTQPVRLELLVDASQNYGTKGLRCEGSYCTSASGGRAATFRSKRPRPIGPARSSHRYLAG